MRKMGVHLSDVEIQEIMEELDLIHTVRIGQQCHCGGVTLPVQGDALAWPNRTHCGTLLEVEQQTNFARSLAAC
eukprot:COSAG05_NODE_5062_length_1274_cov_1.682553_3_plen_73_part_01